MRAEVRRSSEARMMFEVCGVGCEVVCRTDQEEAEIDERACASRGTGGTGGAKVCTITMDGTELLVKKARDADRDLGY